MVNRLVSVAPTALVTPIADLMMLEAAAEREALHTFIHTTFTASATAAGLPLTIEGNGVSLTLSGLKREITRFLNSDAQTHSALDATDLTETFLRRGGGPKVRTLVGLELMRRAVLFAIQRRILEEKLTRTRFGEQAFLDKEVAKRVEHVAELAEIEREQYKAERREKRLNKK